MTVHAVIFDLDGTLLDTLQDLADAGNNALAAHGFPGHPVDAYRCFIGDGLQILAARILPPDRRDTATVVKLLADFRANYRANFAATTRPYDGVPALLDALAARRLPTAILSNKNHEFTVLCVQTLLAGRDFSLVWGQSESVPPKPDPAGALAMASRLAVPPAACVYVGDSGVDMQTATRAGMFAAGALWGFRTAAELEANGANALLAAPLELLNYLDKQPAC